MAIYNVNKTSSTTITQTATRSGGVMRAGGLNLSSLISALAGMSDNQKNRCDIIINDTYSLTQYDSTTYTNSSIQSNGSVISYILDTTTPEFKSRVGSTDTPINVTSWKIIYADDSISGGNSYPANRVTYDNTGTDLTSTTVQGAITEIINGGTENIFDGSIEDWNALSTAEKIAYDHAMINNDYVDNPVGNLNALTTTDKSSCVGAINEVNTKIARNKYVNSTMSSQASVPANTDFMTHKLVIPETGTYLVMGGIFGIGVDLELVIRAGESASGTVIANTWSNKCLFTVVTINANDVLSFWMKADSEQTFYADGRGQKFFAIKLL